MSETDEQPVEVSRIDTRLMRPRDVELVLTEYVAGQPEERVFTIRGNLPTDTMIELFEIEQRIEELEETKEGREDLIKLCDEVQAIVLELVQERNPEVERLGFGMEETLGILAFLAKNHSVAHEVAAAVTGSGTRTPNRAERRARPPRTAAKRTPRSRQR